MTIAMMVRFMMTMVLFVHKSDDDVDDHVVYSRRKTFLLKTFQRFLSLGCF